MRLRIASLLFVGLRWTRAVVPLECLAIAIIVYWNSVTAKRIAQGAFVIGLVTLATIAICGIYIRVAGNYFWSPGDRVTSLPPPITITVSLALTLIETGIVGYLISGMQGRLASLFLIVLGGGLLVSPLFG